MAGWAGWMLGRLFRLLSRSDMNFQINFADKRRSAVLCYPVHVQASCGL